MSDDKQVEFELSKVVKDSYIKWNVPMISIFNPYEEGTKVAAAKRDRGDEINILLHIVNALQYELNLNPDITQYTIAISYSEFSNMLKWQPIQDNKLKFADIREVIEKVNSISNILQMRTDKRNPMTSLYIYSKIDVINWEGKDAVFNIKLNPDFIEYYKGVKFAKDHYFKLTLDVMLSLNTRGAKIVYAYLSAYYNQMSENKHNGGYYETNKTRLEELMMYLDTKRRIDKEGKMIFKMTPKQVVQNVNRALEQINKLTEEKSAKYNEYYPKYKVTWYREDGSIYNEEECKKGKDAKIVSFRFGIDMQYEKANRNKYKTKSNEPTVAQIINNSPFTQQVKDLIFSWYKKQNDEEKACISKQELQQSIDNLTNYEELEQVYHINEAISNNYRVIGRNTEQIKDLKCNQNKFKQSTAVSNAERIYNTKNRRRVGARAEDAVKALQSRRK